MRRMVLVSIVAALLSLAMALPAMAHVHGITPLLELGCKVDNTVTGANRTDETPAAAGDEGPVSGLIPSTVGNSPLGVQDGGFGAANDDVCP